MYRDDLAATHARVEQLQRELTNASREGASDKQRIAALSAQLAATQQAWAMGNEEMRRMDAGQTPEDQRGSVSAGRICGIIASCFLMFGGLIFLMLLAAAPK